MIGEKEQETGTVSVRRHGGEDLGVMKVEEFKNFVLKEIEEKIASFEETKSVMS